MALHDKRVEEERAGTVRWLRPEYQRVRFAGGASTQTRAAEDEATVETGIVRPPSEPWPADAVGQITALRTLVLAGPITVDAATSRFTNAPREIVARHLETLAILGEVRALGGDQYGPSVPAS